MTVLDEVPVHEGSSPLPLDDAERAWVVVSGSVDVFAVPRVNGVLGPRRHLWSGEAGDVLPPAPPIAPAGFVLTAIGVGATRLRPIAPEELNDAVHAPAIDRLVAALCPLFAGSSQVALHEILEPGRQSTLSAGWRAGIRENTVWIRHLEGSSRIAGAAPLEIRPEDGWVPLHGTWIEPAAETAHLETRDTRHMAGEDAADGLRKLLHLVQSRLSARIESEEAQTDERFRAKTISSRRMWHDALRRLATLLLRKDAQAEPEAAAIRFPLLAACHTVGRAEGIVFREPPAWEIERSGADLLAAICRASRVRSRRVALRGRWWRTDGGSMVGYLREDHTPVALLSEGASYVVVDPRSGVRRPVTDDVAGEIQSFAVTFYRPLPETARSLRDLLSFVLPLAKSDMARIVTVALAAALAALGIPLATAQVFNEVIPNGRTRDLGTVLISLCAITAGSALFDIARAFALTRLEGRISAALQPALVDRLLSLPVPFFRRFSVGDLSQRAAAIQNMQEVLGTSTLTVLLASVFSTVNVLILFYFDWRLALLSVALIVVAAAVNALLVRMALRHEQRQHDAQGRVAGLLFQMIAGIAKLRVSGSEERAFAVWSTAFSKQREHALRSGGYKAALSVFNEALPVAATAALFGVGGWMLFQQGQSFRTGDFVAFAAAFGSLFAAMVAVSNASTNLIPATALVEKARPIIETAPEVTEAKGDPGALQGLIEGTHLTFRYHSDGPVILDDVSFRADPGQFVALVGPSGSGKSTTLRLLLGFETPETGAVYYDGQDLASIDITALRNQQLGVVLQRSRLLSGDIFTNIVGSSSNLTIEDAWEAAEAAGLADDIREMPMGMHTLISEGGSTFSGGQRQRLLIARALVRKPRIILFDEATSALDNRTQETVTRTLELSSATRFVIAHRLSTIRKADRIYVLERGRIVEGGTFAELARSNGLFSRLISRQQA